MATRDNQNPKGLTRRAMLLAGGSALVTGGSLSAGKADTPATATMVQLAAATTDKPNILVIFGDDIGYWNISAYNRGMMGYRTPNIDRIASEGAILTDYYGQQSCTAGRAAFITGQSPMRTGLLKVGLPGAKEGLSEKDPTLADLLKPLGYATGQFGKNHLGDRNEFLSGDLVPAFHRILNQPGRQLGGTAAGTDGRRHAEPLERIGDAPPRSLGAVGEMRLHAEIGDAGHLVGDLVGFLVEGVACRQRHLRAFLEIDDEGDRDPRAARPLGIGRRAAVALEVTHPCARSRRLATC
jgi:hypothetical protein